jgi:hypothetical protein
LHIMAVVQLRNPTPGRTYFDSRKAAGKTSMEAMRALKRQGAMSGCCRVRVGDRSGGGLRPRTRMRGSSRTGARCRDHSVPRPAPCAGNLARAPKRRLGLSRNPGVGRLGR